MMASLLVADCSTFLPQQLLMVTSRVASVEVDVLRQEDRWLAARCPSSGVGLILWMHWH